MSGMVSDEVDIGTGYSEHSISAKAYLRPPHPRSRQQRYGVLKMTGTSGPRD